MLPGTAMRDIMVHNVMQPFANIFRTRGNVHSRSDRPEADTRTRGNVHSRSDRRTRDNRADTDSTWSREKRRQWWRSLGEVSRSSASSSSSSSSSSGQKVFTLPVDRSHIAKSRQKRTVVGLYSYAPWLTNDVRTYIFPHFKNHKTFMIWNNNVSYWRQFTQWNQNILEKISI